MNTTVSKSGTLPLLAPKTALALSPHALHLLAAVLLLAPFFLGDYGLHLAISGGIMSLGAMALTVLCGTAGLPSLGTAAFLGIGGFSAGILASKLGLSLLPAMATGAAIGALLGLLVALLTIRVSGLYLAVGTLALQHIVSIVATDIDIRMTFASGFLLDAPQVLGIAIDSPVRWWLLTLVLMTLLFSLLSYLLGGAVGREWNLLREQPTAAGTLGISATRSRAGVFALSSAVIAATGAVDAYYIGNVQAGAYTIHVAVAYLTVIVLGGAGRLAGAVIAAYVVILLPVTLTALLRWLGVDASRVAGIENIVLGLILIFSLVRGRQHILHWLTLRKTTHD